MAEWLGRSLQSFERGFDSLSRLQDDTNQHPLTPKKYHKYKAYTAIWATLGNPRNCEYDDKNVSTSVSRNRFSQNPTHKIRSS